MKESPQFKAMEKLTKGFTGVPIAEYAIEKMKTYAELAGRSEIYGFPVCSAEKRSGFIEDAILAINQEVTGASGNLDGWDAGLTNDEIEKRGLISIGFWHSHGNHGVFHSGTDDKNREAYMEALAAENERKGFQMPVNHQYLDLENKRLISVVNGSVVSMGIDPKTFSFSYSIDSPEKDPQERLALTYKTGSPLKINDGLTTAVITGYKDTKVQEFEPEVYRTLGVAYSVVVNRRGEVYGELFVSRWCSYCEETKIKVVKDAEIIPISLGKFTIDKDQLQRDLEERVKGFKEKTRGGLFGW